MTDKHISCDINPMDMLKLLLGDCKMVNFCLGTTFLYLSTYKQNGGINDINAAARFLDYIYNNDLSMDTDDEKMAVVLSSLMNKYAEDVINNNTVKLSDFKFGDILVKENVYYMVLSKGIFNGNDFLTCIPCYLYEDKTMVGLSYQLIDYLSLGDVNNKWKKAGINISEYVPRDFKIESFIFKEGDK